MTQNIQFAGSENPLKSSDAVEEKPTAPTPPFLPKAFFFLFLIGFIVFIPMGMLMTDTIKKEKETARNQYEDGFRMRLKENNTANEYRSVPQLESESAARLPAEPTPRNAEPLSIAELDAERNRPSSPASPPMTKENDLSVRQKSIDSVVITIQAHVNIISYCRRQGLTITSGKGGQPMCGTYNWGYVASCGSKPQDMEFTVFNGDSDNWDLTVQCKNAPYCNGPENAICNQNGCTFSGTCQTAQ